MKRIALLAATALLAPASAAHATTTVSNVAGTLRIDSVGKETNVIETLAAGRRDPRQATPPARSRPASAAS